MSGSPAYHDCSNCSCAECWMVLGSSEGEHRVHDHTYGLITTLCFCRSCGGGGAT
ncbi:MAG: hypothetical protein KGJ23_08430 [Euryarchaeota archaeon]|nr:hypothetical protein [Euryarchaeota archaeon]MDE1836628.1 hypothetical protein [Euryarchaeota archaeon]MDE1879177.1 hypothetical protein [Euryarchaeota archaeon]MDE2044598.1 hypothetical protein [Thermoplasmata archaeon]